MEEAEHTPSSSNYRVSKAKVYLPMIVMLITGALDVILFKLQSQQEYFNPDKKKTMTFQHPFVQSAYSFLGELLCLLFYGIGIWYYGKVQISDSEEKKDEHLKRNINVMWLAIPALFDIVGSTLLFIALTLISASIYQMLRGFIMFITTMQSIIFLKRRYHRHHWFSLTLIVLGVGVVGASSVIYSEEENESDHNNNPILGIILIISSQIFTAGLMITEEKILRKYYVHPLKVVGWEGFWGFTFYIVILLVLQFIPCNQEDICPYGTVENVPQAFYEVSQNWWILVCGVVVCFSIAIFNSTGVAVTKYASAAQRCTIDASRTILVWIFFLIKPGKGKEKFVWMQLVGFVFLVFGTLIFNEILIIPLCGFNKNIAEVSKNQVINESQSNNTMNKSLLTDTQLCSDSIENISKS